MKFRIRMMLSILLVTMIGIGILFIGTYYIATDLVETNYAKTSTEAFKLRMQQLDEDMRTVYQRATALSVEQKLKDNIEIYLKNADTEAALLLSEYLMKENNQTDLIDAVFLYLPDTEQILCSQEYRGIIEVANKNEYPWIAQKQKNLTPWIINDMGGTPMNQIYLYARPIYADNGEHIGTVGLSISERTIYYNFLDVKNDSERYLLTDNNGIICSSGNASEFGVSVENIIGKIPRQGYTEVGKFNDAQGRNVYVNVKSGFTGFSLIGLVENSALTQDLKQTQWVLCIVFSIVVLLTIQLANYISKSLSRPLGDLMYAMERLGSGDFRIRAPAWSDDEFLKLGSRFNDMVVQINDLIAQVIAEQKHVRQAELRALQYQIKPHFMYNTLNSIKFSAIMQGNDMVGEQLGYFIELLEASLNKNGDFNTLEFELRVLSDYTSLQQYRYMGCFELMYEIEEQAKNCIVPKFLLQPLVENSILHGMDTKKNDNKIAVIAEIQGEKLHIEVLDNGKGMTQQEQDAVMKRGADSRRQFNGIGVSNTEERLRLFYGDEIKFELITQKDMGTRYIIEIPVKQEEEE